MARSSREEVQDTGHTIAATSKGQQHRGTEAWERKG